MISQKTKRKQILFSIPFVSPPPSLLLSFLSFLYRPNSRIMLHQPSGGAQGMASDIDIQAREILRTRANLNQLYVKHTSQPLERIESVMERDYFMDVEQAVEFGVIDKVLDKREMKDEEEDVA